LLSAIKLVFSQEYLVKKIELNVGTGKDNINLFYDDVYGLTSGGFCMDTLENVYIADIGDSSIKKFDKKGKYCGRVKIKESLFRNVYYYQNKLFTLDRIAKKNDLYIFDSSTLKLKSVKRNLYYSISGVQPYEFWDNMLIINQLNRYIVYDLERDTLAINLKSPFYYKNISLEEKEFLAKRVKPNFSPNYIGKISNGFLLIKRLLYYVDNIFELAIIDIKKDKILKCNIAYIKNQEDFNVSFFEEIRLYKKKYIAILGSANNKIIITIIDIEKIFSNENLKEASNKYLAEYLGKLTSKELQIMRNTIYARYGRVFKTKWLQEYFEGQPWYYKNSNYSNLLLKDNEKEIIEIIKSVENHKKR
jgi:hypothetical protein